MSAVDVVIPCYNYGRYLSACVHSVLSQCGVSVRVLIIDDCSSDNTAQIGQELATSDGRVEFRRHKINKGHIATYNEGLMDWSSADYSVLLSADDLLAPGSLCRATQIMDADDSIGLVYGHALYFTDEDDIHPIKSRTCGYTRWSGTEWLEGRCRGGNNVISSPEVVVRGDIQRAVGGYRPELPHTGDLEMWLRIAAVSDVAYVRGMPQAYYRIHADSMLRTNYLNKLVDLQQRKAAFDSFFKYYENVIPEAHRLYALANRALAREALWEACRAYDRNEVERSAANELELFATTTYPKVTPEAVALRRRKFIGPTICHRTQVFAISALVRRVYSILRHERWKWQGI